MRTIQDRAIQLLEVIFGKEQLESMIADETGAILQGGFFVFCNDKMQKSINFGYADISFVDYDSHRSIIQGVNSFSSPFSRIENDENKYLAVSIDWDTKSHDIHNWWEDHNALVEKNNDIILSIATLFEGDLVMDMKYAFEEFQGKATRFYKFGFRPRSGRVEFSFFASNLNLSTDTYFWNCLSYFLKSRYNIAVSTETLQSDYKSIISKLVKIKKEQ